jgi:long-chain acyl-CoA synthetase
MSAASGVSSSVLRQTPSDWVSHHAKATPERPALVDGDVRCSYAELEERVDRMSGALAEAGVEVGDAVATLLPNSWQMVVIILATWRRGAISLPINPQYKSAEIRTTLGQARPKVIFASAALGTIVDGALEGLDGDDALRIGVPNGPDGWRPYAELKGAAPEPTSRSDLDGSEPALWLYSSGSTGGSKKISRSFAQLAAEGVAFGTTVKTTRDDVILCAVPLSHAHGLGNGLVAAALVGATLVVHERFDRRRFLTSAEQDGVTIIPGSPFMFKILAETRMPQEPDLSRIRLCFTAGAPLAHEVFEACRERFGLDVRQLYGSTETGAASINLADDLDKSWASVGAPLDGVEIGVFGPDGEPLPPETEGAIGVRSPAMFDGYEIDELNVNALRGGRFFAGDRGRLDTEGRLYITGRDTLFINLAGNKVDPTEVETALSEHPKVSECIVLGVAPAGGDEVVKAVVVTSEPCEASELLAFCRGRIADFKLPRIIEFRDEIPRNPLGKVLRKYLK